MGRINYLIRLIIRIAFVVLCFLATFVFTAVGNYQTDGIIMTNTVDSSNLIITTKNGATVENSVNDGILTLDIVQDGTECDDIKITLKTNPIKYDITYLEKVMGNKPKYKEYIEDMKTGPWSATIKYRLMGDSIITKGNKSFSLQYRDELITQLLSSKAANTNNSSKEIILFEDDVFTIDIIMGTQGSGALPSGKYYLYTELDISGLYGLDNPKLSFGESIPVFASIVFDSLKTVSFDKIFNVGSWLTFYFMMVIVGFIFFAYSDFRAVFKAADEAKDGTISVLYSIYINGQYCGQETRFEGHSERSFIGSIIFYILMLFTIPLRLLVQIINCIIHIIKGDDYSDGDPIFANILGSLGVYLVIFTILGFISALSGSFSYIPVIIGGVVGIGLLIIANILSKNKEELYI